MLFCHDFVGLSLLRVERLPLPHEWHLGGWVQWQVRGNLLTQGNFNYSTIKASRDKKLEYMYVCINVRVPLKLRNTHFKHKSAWVQILTLGGWKGSSAGKVTCCSPEEPALFPAPVLEVHNHCEFSARSYGNYLWLLWVPTYTWQTQNSTNTHKSK